MPPSELDGTDESDWERNALRSSSAPSHGPGWKGWWIASVAAIVVLGTTAGVFIWVNSQVYVKDAHAGPNRDPFCGYSYTLVNGLSFAVKASVVLEADHQVVRSGTYYVHPGTSQDGMFYGDCYASPGWRIYVKSFTFA